MPALLWVVKTANSKSLSHSDNQERVQIFRQARRVSRRRKAGQLRPPPDKKSPKKTADGLKSLCDDDLSLYLSDESLLSFEQIINPRPLAGLDTKSSWTAAEIRGVAYFQEVVVHKIITLQRDLGFWTGFLSCLTQHDAGCRHLVVAIAATFELLFLPDFADLNKFALEQCNKALRAILSTQDSANSRLLVSCLLVTAYHLLRSDLEAADRNIESGHRMLASFTTTENPDRQIVRIINSVGRQHGYKLWAPDVAFQFDKTTAGREPLFIDTTLAVVPFTTVGQVLAAFKTVIVDFIAKPMRNLSLGAHIDPNTAFARDVCRFFSHIMFHWEAYYQCLSDDQGDEKLQLEQIKIGILSAYILFMGKVIESNERRVDDFTPRYREMLRLGQRVISARHAGRPVLYIDRIVNGALYTSALCCRHPVVRRNMIAPLKGQLIYDDGLVNYLRGRVVEMVAEIEEADTNPTTCHDIPEEKRVRPSGLMCHVDRSLAVQYMMVAELDRLHLRVHSAPVGKELDHVPIQDINDALQGMATAYRMYTKADCQEAPDGCLREMCYRGRPVPVKLRADRYEDS